MEESIVPSLIELGGVGIFAAFAVGLFWQERSERIRQTEARLEDHKEILHAANEMKNAVAALTEVVRSMKG